MSNLQKATVIVLNTSLVACIVVLFALLLLSIQGAPYLVIHVSFLLVLAVSLLILINWFLTQIGTVKAEDQRRELFGPQIQDKQESQGASEPALDVASGKAEQGDPEHSQSSPGAFKGGKVQ